MPTYIPNIITTTTNPFFNGNGAMWSNNLNGGNEASTSRVVYTNMQSTIFSQTATPVPLSNNNTAPETFSGLFDLDSQNMITLSGELNNLSFVNDILMDSISKKDDYNKPINK